jgi:transposase
MIWVGVHASLPVCSGTRCSPVRPSVHTRGDQPTYPVGKTTVIPSKTYRKQPRAFDRDMYATHELIENVFIKLKQVRPIAARYDRTARNFFAAIQLVACVVWAN